MHAWPLLHVVSSHSTANLSVALSHLGAALHALGRSGALCCNKTGISWNGEPQIFSSLHHSELVPVILGIQILLPGSIFIPCKEAKPGQTDWSLNAAASALHGFQSLQYNTSCITPTYLRLHCYLKVLINLKRCSFRVTAFQQVYVK